jgi:hypothetical protein
VKKAPLKSALFDTFISRLGFLRDDVQAILDEMTWINRENFETYAEKALTIYHRRPLTAEGAVELNARDRAGEAKLGALRAKLVVKGREIATFSLHVDSLTTAADRIHTLTKPINGRYDSSVASLGHLILCGAADPQSRLGLHRGALAFALHAAWRDYRDNIGVGPEYASIEHVACENYYMWSHDDNVHYTEKQIEKMAMSSGQSITFGGRECGGGPDFTGVTDAEFERTDEAGELIGKFALKPRTTITDPVPVRRARSVHRARCAEA